MFILDLLLAVFALAPFGLLVLFWKVFHEDRGVHPIYRNAELCRLFGSRPFHKVLKARARSWAQLDLKNVRPVLDIAAESFSCGPSQWSSRFLLIQQARAGGDGTAHAWE